MKISWSVVLGKGVTFLLLLSALHHPLSTRAQGTAFTYQGRLNNNAVAANGNYDFSFTIYDAPTGGAPLGSFVLLTAVPVSNGLFTVTINTNNEFGANAFTGAARWLEIGVRTNCGCLLNFTILSPRQLLTATPYALRALSLTTKGLAAGAYNNAVNFDNAGNSFSGNGAALTGLNASQLTSGTVPLAWLSTSVSLLGQSIETAEITDANITEPKLASGSISIRTLNSGVRALMFSAITSGSPFFFPLRLEADSGLAPAIEFRLGGLRALRLEDNGDSNDNGTNPDGAPNIIGGSPVNSVGTGVVGATICGGGATNYFGLPHANVVMGNFSVIGGGFENLIQTIASFSIIGGGEDNTIQSNTAFATISGGENNNIGTGNNTPTIGGGYGNTIGNSTASSTISGGWGNTIPFGAQYATIPGGQDNVTSGNFSFAAGRRAKANQPGSFVWCDSLDQDGSSQGNNTFTARASGGYYLFSSSGNTGVNLPAGSGSWSSLSDRASKTNFAVINGRDVLERLARIPIQSWNYIAQGEHIRHAGPIAQDFHAAFGLGEDDKHIATVDADGVALAAIQGLNQKLEEQRAENAELKQRLEALEKFIRSQKSN